MTTGLVFGGERAVLLDQVGAAPWLLPDGRSGAGAWAGDAPWMTGEPHLARLAGDGLGLTAEDSPVLWSAAEG